jgi:hypothetical protein
MTKVCSQLLEAVDPTSQYVNGHGVFPYGETWGIPLRIAAKWACVLEQLQPDDGVAYVRFFLFVKTLSSDSGMSAMALALLFLAHTMKWPPAVNYFEELLRSRWPSTAEDLRALYRQVVEFCDGKDWPVMFERMNFGLMDSVTGVNNNAKFLGLALICTHLYIKRTHIKCFFK